MSENKTVSFTYTKTNGEVSKRVVVPLTYSSPKHRLVIDVSDKDRVVIGSVYEAAEKARQEYLARLYEICNFNNVQIKTFLVSGISNES